MRASRFAVVIVAVLLCSRASAVAGAAKTTGIPRFDAAVDRAAGYLRANVAQNSAHQGALVFAGYALFKTGDPIDSPVIAAAIQDALGRTAGTEYRTVDDYHHVYVAGIDAMLLSDIDPVLYQPQLQKIALYIEAVQRPDGSWSNPPVGRGSPPNAGDVSMSQYGMLGLWAAQRAGCTVNPQKVELGVSFLLRGGNPDGGWPYRPGTTEGPGGGASTHNMTMAAAGTIMLGRLMLHGLKGAPKPEKEEALFGALEKLDEEEVATPGGKAFPGYNAGISASDMDGRANRAFGWNEARFEPVQRTEHNMYFYYALERAATIAELKEVQGQNWYEVYGDGMLTLQAQDGSFGTHTGPVVGTSFALLYFMRSTKQIIEKQFAGGRQKGDRGNPFGKKEVVKEPTELDRLIDDIAKMDFEKLDEAPIEVADEIVRSVTSITDPAELIGQKDKLKSLMEHPNADVRKSVCWALGRTGDFSLIPLMLDGIRDPSIDVNVEAIAALRYIARKPGGFGETLNPLEGLEKASPEERLKVANEWRQKVLDDWSAWYFAARPYEETDSLDELQVKVPLKPGP